MYSKIESAQIRKNFWVKFDEFSRKYLGARGKWITYNTGIKDIVLKFDVNREYARVLLSVECKDEDMRFDVFCKFHECEEMLISILGKNWIWNEQFVLDNGKTVCAMYKQLDNVNIMNEDDWTKIFTFFAEEMTRLEKALVEIRPFFQEYVKQLKRIN